MTRSTPDGSEHAASADVLRIGRLIKREIVMLLALGAIAVAAFFGTRAAAEANRRMHRADAARWFAIGQHHLAAGTPAQAAAALHRAVALVPDERSYRLTLATALRADGDRDAARAVLIRLRTIAPEDPDVNAELARLAADTDPQSALRFYHSSLEALWEPEHDDARRRLRVEIINFLLDRGLTSRALSEVLALASDLPDEPGAHVQAGQLLLRAGDPPRALRQFRAALEADPSLAPARLGAARAEFELGNYGASYDDLRRLSSDEREAAELRELVSRVLTMDPLLRGLSTRERQRRLSNALADVIARTERCRTTLCGNDEAPCAEFGALMSGARPLQRRIRTPRRYVSHDNVEADLAAIADLSARTSAACGAGSTSARALTLIVRRHGLDGRP